MNTELKDVLHLYYGAECMFGYSMAKLRRGTIGPIAMQRFSNSDGLIKPILRKLDSMTEEEMKQVATICYMNVYDSKPEFTEVTLLSDSNAAGLRFKEKDLETWEYGLTVSAECILFSANGSYLTVNTFPIVSYLLSLHFDLFNLIDNGMAIEKSSIANQQYK